jgi:hypothetical protein
LAAEHFAKPATILSAKASFAAQEFQNTYPWFKLLNLHLQH